MKKIKGRKGSAADRARSTMLSEEIVARFTEIGAIIGRNLGINSSTLTHAEMNTAAHPSARAKARGGKRGIPANSRSGRAGRVVVRMPK